MCKISIIVPLYNGEKTIERCLDSLIGQELKDIEIIVVDDGSVDNGAELVKGYIKRDSRIRLISQSNKGAGAARNYGIAKAKGQYVGFVDCDDFVDTNMYGKLITVLEQTGVSVAVCQEKNVYVENGEVQFINETKFENEKEEVYSSNIILEWQLNYKYMSLNSLCYKVVDRRILIDNNIKIPEGNRQGEDLVASVGIFTSVEKVAVVPESLYYYVHTKGSTSYSYSLKHAEDIYFDWKEVLEYISKSDCKIDLNNFSLGCYFTSLKQLSWALNKKDRTSLAAMSLKKKWKEERKFGKWKPNFKRINVPMLHRVKVYLAYMELCRPVFAAVNALRWIPFFKYMA